MSIEIPEGYKLIKFNKEAMKAAQKKYRETHRDQIKARQTKLYMERYHNDKEFREKENKRHLESYNKKKSKKIQEKNTLEISEKNII